jgi:hypothetical protein
MVDKMDQFISAATEDRLKASEARGVTQGKIDRLTESMRILNRFLVPSLPGGSEDHGD